MTDKKTNTTGLVEHVVEWMDKQYSKMPGNLRETLVRGITTIEEEETNDQMKEQVKNKLIFLELVKSQIGVVNVLEATPMVEKHHMDLCKIEGDRRVAAYKQQIADAYAFQLWKTAENTSYHPLMGDRASWITVPFASKCDNRAYIMDTMQAPFYPSNLFLAYLQKLQAKPK